MSLQGFYTTKGLALAAKLAAGTGLTITRVTAGSGETAASAAALAQERQTLTVGEAAVSGQSAVLPATLAEAGASAAYTLTELGVYARDPQEGEILYQVFRLSEGRAITAGGGSAYRFYLKQTVGAAGVTVTCSPAGLLTGEDLQPLRTALARKPDAVQGNITLHVAKTGNDTTGDGSESKPYLTIQKALNSLPKLLLARADIVIHGGTYEEAVLVYGFSGVNSLTIEGAENETVKIKTVDIRAVNLAEAVQLRNVELVGTSEDGYNFSVKTVDAEFVVLENVSCTNATASSHWGRFGSHTRCLRACEAVRSRIRRSRSTLPPRWFTWTVPSQAQATPSASAAAAAGATWAAMSRRAVRILRARNRKDSVVRYGNDGLRAGDPLRTRGKGRGFRPRL